MLNAEKLALRWFPNAYSVLLHALFGGELFEMLCVPWYIHPVGVPPLCTCLLGGSVIVVRPLLLEFCASAANAANY